MCVLGEEDEEAPAPDGERRGLAAMLGGVELDKLGRYEFYDAAPRPAVRLAISTGEGRVFANLLVTVGVA